MATLSRRRRRGGGFGGGAAVRRSGGPAATAVDGGGGAVSSAMASLYMFFRLRAGGRLLRLRRCFSLPPGRARTAPSDCAVSPRPRRSSGSLAGQVTDLAYDGRRLEVAGGAGLALLRLVLSTQSSATRPLRASVLWASTTFPRVPIPQRYARAPWGVVLTSIDPCFGGAPRPGGNGCVTGSIFHLSYPRRRLRAPVGENSQHRAANSRASDRDATATAEERCAGRRSRTGRRGRRQ